MVKALVINLYGTIAPVSGKLYLREGVERFLDEHSDKYIAIVGRKKHEEVVTDLHTLGIEDKISEIYSDERLARCMSYFNIPDNIRADPNASADYIESIKSGKIENNIFITEPMLTVIASYAAESFGIKETGREFSNELITISDHPGDIDASYFNQVKCIKVPTFTEKNDTFSFDKVNLFKTEMICFGRSFIGNYNRRIDLK